MLQPIYPPFFSEPAMADSSEKKDTKQCLLDSAATLFSDKGFANTSIAEISARADANIAAVNYHFRSKDELYREVIRYTYEQAEERYPMETGKTESGEERLYLFIHSLLKRILSKETCGNFYNIVTKEMAEPTLESGTLIHEIISVKRQQLMKLVRDLYQQPANEELILRMTHSIVSQCLFLGMHAKGREHHMKGKPLCLQDAESYARHITDFSIAGIKGYKKT